MMPAALLSPVDRMRRRIGLLVNPVAGLGGRVGLKGSDGASVQAHARALGAVPQAGERAAAAIAALVRASGEAVSFDLFVGPEEMGEEAARLAGAAATTLGRIEPGFTTADDTRTLAREMVERGAELLLFAGGDGTARDLVAAVGTSVPVVGIPAGVKIYSAAFATSPSAAGELAAAFLMGRAARLRETEVVDLDEELYRQSVVSTRLYGFLLVPYARDLVQNAKAPSPASEEASARAIAEDVVESVGAQDVLILGPGTTTRAIAERLGLPKTLIGVDVITATRVIATDVGQGELLAAIRGVGAPRLIVTPTGGQGFLLGRGNQQIGPEVLRTVGNTALVVVATPHKLIALQGRPLRVDTGDSAIDASLRGWVSVITGYRERVVYRIA